MRRFVLYNGRLKGEIKPDFMLEFGVDPDRLRFTWPSAERFTLEPGGAAVGVPIGEIRRVFQSLDLEVWEAAIIFGDASEAFARKEIFSMVEEDRTNRLAAAISVLLSDARIDAEMPTLVKSRLAAYADFLRASNVT
jgi:hypothetical protein